jgi:hypothetical protein
MPADAVDAMSTAQTGAMPDGAMDGDGGMSAMGAMDAAQTAVAPGTEAQPDALTAAVDTAMDAAAVAGGSPAADTGAPADAGAADAAVEDTPQQSEDPTVGMG